MTPSEPGCPAVPCSALGHVEKDVNALGEKVRRMQAVLVGEHVDEDGGLREEVREVRAQFRDLETSLRTLRWAAIAFAVVTGIDSVPKLFNLFAQAPK